MLKSEFNNKLRSYVKDHLSPTQCVTNLCNQCDRCFVTAIYNSIKSLLNNDCIQIGSYPRYTAIRPLHDLDILYILGNWDELENDPRALLEELKSKIDSEYTNPTNYNIETTLQTHSVSISYKQRDEVVFSVDIVPAYIFAKNEFNLDMYKVPELLMKTHGKNRIALYEQIISENRAMGWINSDPRGYTQIASNTNQINPDFRKTAKFVKAWKNSCKDIYDDFPLKSFHLEQVITQYFQSNHNSDIFDAIFAFFVNLPSTIHRPQTIDRADSSKFIDEYLNDLTSDQRTKVIEARDCFLIKLENLTETDSVSTLVKGCFYNRFSSSEKYLFDSGIPTLTNDYFDFSIYGEVQEKTGGFRKYILDKSGLVDRWRKIRFKIRNPEPYADLFKWKVKNDNSSSQPRGEITDHRTWNYLEEIQYYGNHFVECYAILDGVCVAKAHQDVVLKR